MSLPTAMLADQTPVRSNLPGFEMQVLKFVGGTAAITQSKGLHIPITYISTGVVELTFPVGVDYTGLIGGGFEATTFSAVAGYDFNGGVYNATTKKVRVYIYANSAGTPTLVDLAALQWLTLVIGIQQQG